MEITRKENQQNISKIVDWIFTNKDKLDLIFWNGSGFVKYISGNSKCLWSEFFNDKYPTLEVSDFFTLSQIQYGYEKHIQRINHDVEKKHFKHFGYKEFVSSLRKFSFYIKDNKKTAETNFTINFMTTNHCKSLENYFEVNNAYYVDDLSNVLNSNYNCFYLHSYNESKWVYDLKGYNEFLKSKINDMYNFFSQHFMKNFRIIFIFGTSLNEIHLLLLIYQLQLNEKCLIVIFRKVKFKEEYLKGESSNLNMIENDIAKLNEEMTANISTLNLYINDDDKYDEIWKNLNKELNSKMDNMYPSYIYKIPSKCEKIPTISEIVLYFKELSKRERSEMLNSFLEKKNYQILDTLWNNYCLESDTLEWYLDNDKEGHDYFKKYDIHELISKFYYLPPKGNENVYILLNSFISNNNITDLEIKLSESDILSFLNKLSTTDFLTKESVELCLNAVISIFTKQAESLATNSYIYSESVSILEKIFKFKNIDFKFAVLKSFELHTQNIYPKYIELEFFNFLHQEFAKESILSFEDMLNYINKKKPIDLINSAHDRYVSVFISSYYVNQTEIFRKFLAKELNNVKLAPNYYLVLRANEDLRKNFNKEFIELEKKYKKIAFYNLEGIYYDKRIDKIYAGEKNMEFIRKWNFQSSEIEQMLKKIIKADVFGADNENHLVAFFNKIKSDENAINMLKNLEIFFNLIIQNEQYLKVIKYYYSFSFSIYTPTFEKLITLLKNKQINKNIFIKMVNILSGFKSFSEVIFNLFDKSIVSDKKLITKLIEISYGINNKQLIKSVLSFFVGNKYGPDIYNLSTRINQNPIRLIDVFEDLFKKSLLNKVLELVWPDNAYNNWIIQIFQGPVDIGLSIFKILLLAGGKVWKVIKLKLSPYESELVKFIDFLILDNVVDENNKWVRVKYYHDFFQTILSCFGTSKMAELIFTIQNIKFLDKINYMFELTTQMIFLVKKNWNFSNEQKLFIKSNSSKIMDSMFNEIFRVNDTDIESFISFVQLIYDNYDKKINDAHFSEIQKGLLDFIYMHDLSEYSNVIRNLLVLAIFLVKKITNNYEIRDMPIYKFLNTNKEFLNFDLSSVIKLEEKFKFFIKDLHNKRI